MNPEERLAAILSALEGVGLSCLIMGGHAVRHYGLQRHTNDFDLTLAPEGWGSLLDRLVASRLFPDGIAIEGPSWRPGAFRRFQIGTLADGQEEWLEFWKENHLLDSFADLFARRELATYGGGELPFLGLRDLIRSKETERGRDWDDIAHLEEVQDVRLHVRCIAGELSSAEALAQVRSRRGFDTYLAEGRLGDTASVRAALGLTINPITQAFLLPSAPDALLLPPMVAIEPIVERKLRSLTPACSLHRSLVEVVRRQYKVACQDRDRANKEVIRAQQTQRP